MAELSIRRPVFITCLFILILAVGFLSLKILPVDLFPDVTFPIVTVSTPYPGSGPSEVENLVSKKIEDELSSISGIKALRSVSREGVSTVIAEFNLSVDIKYAEQQVRDRVSAVRNKLPDDIEEPVIRRVDPADQPIMFISVSGRPDMGEAELFDLADQVIKPRLEQVEQVGLVEIVGGRKREIRVELDLEKLREFDISASNIRQRLATTGKNVPAGKVDKKEKTNVFRTMGEFRSVQEIEHVPINFFNNENAVRMGQVARIVDGLEEEKTRTFVNGTKGLLLQVFRQSGSNTVAVVDGIKKKAVQINKEIEGQGHVEVIRDGAKPIRANIADVNEAIIIGVILTVIVVFFFLASFRSTLITSLALPNSLLGAFILMAAAGFSINIMTLLALSLAVGLLIDDAIVVRENIFRHIEMGKSPADAARDGTNEVILAVVATTMTVIAVFGPIGFLQGVVGQFFKEFGLTICFAMLISLFDALTMAPMLSAYFAGGHNHEKKKGRFALAVERMLKAFDRFQTRLENRYVGILHWTMRWPKTVLAGSVAVFVLSLFAAGFVPKTFLPPQDNGEFMVAIDLKPGTSLQAMTELSIKIQDLIRANPEVKDTILIVGDKEGESNTASFFITLVESHERQVNTSQLKERVREQLKPFAYANPVVKDYDAVGGGQRAFNLNIIGQDLKQLEEVSQGVFEKLKNHPGLKDVDLSYRPGKPEVQIDIDPVKAQQIGVLTAAVGDELRALVEGVTPAVFREHGREYDVRIRLSESQRDIAEQLRQLKIPNMNGRLTNITNVAVIRTTTGPTSINREDRQRYIAVQADIAPDGPGMGGVINDIHQMFKETPLPNGMRYRFAGQAENFAELLVNMVIAMGLGVLFIYLVLASLYESFIIPFAIMLVLPLAACGAFYALLITRSSLDLFSMIGVVMLLGIATKNSIILVDYIHQLTEKGANLRDAIFEAGRTRLRPIMMTSFALIAGMLPVAIGLNEASKQRTSMGIAIIGGLVSSTLLTLVVIPAAYVYIERFQHWLMKWFSKIASDPKKAHSPAPHPEHK
ncbi:MAG: efflux RND transporter permease subunit [Bdellovibrionaceae bacterium]|nr:efflux RND transporter permease subunit [Pseudobdellovibrionaceae bacterium]